MNNFVVQRQCRLDQSEHLSIISDPITAGDILNALDPEHTVDPPCTPVLPFVGAPLFLGPQ
jgi:triacylglycerol lipase